MDTGNLRGTPAPLARDNLILSGFFGKRSQQYGLQHTMFANRRSQFSEFSLIEGLPRLIRVTEDQIDRYFVCRALRRI